MSIRFQTAVAFSLAALIPGPTALAAQGRAPAARAAATPAPAGALSSGTFSGLEMRSIGPALTSGRIIDLAVDPSHRNIWYVATAGGGVWKTTTAGTTWKPIFDGEGSYSIGCVTLDPNDPLVVWVGSGENNAQRSVSYGDGVYKSLDGGETWQNVGLKNSEHIGKIVIDPRDSNVVYVAAQGPLWNDGGDRGLYKTVDGGKTWTQSLKISDQTGVADVWMDPRNPDVLYATSYQRQRRVWTVVAGGPEGAVYKSRDAGATWQKLEGGLPKGDLGRIGLAVSPANPDVIYAVIEASDPSRAGTYRSTNAGGTWQRRSGYTSSGQYYHELFPDPNDVDRVYAVNVFLQVTEDGAKTFQNAGEKDKHVDNHVVWIDPDNTDHLLNGNDGGLYETWDRGQSWRYFANLPITQFYRVAVDDARPFYNVYGGTQDNHSLGGPSRTINGHGIANSDWYVTQEGDGFVSRVDPEDPNTVYAESQHAGLGRYDKRTRERVDIQPQAGATDAPLRWNWDSPLIISPHSSKRLYFAAQLLFRSDDRGDHWKAVSPDLTRQIDRNTLKIMGKVWSVDAVGKNTSTSFYGNIVSLAESPKQEGLLYVGTDDGLIQISEDGGGAWRKVERVGSVPEMTYVSDLEASPHDGAVVYAAFDNHKMGDFKPYVYRSGDRGRTWTSIAGDLPERGTVYAIGEDPGKAGLLFAGTEFGLFFSIDMGRHWVQLKGGLPIAAVRDLAFQERAGDLVIATFGRGFYVLDDLTPLRQTTTALLDQEAALLPVRTAPVYIEAHPLGYRDKGFQGANFYAAPNPPFGATFTYYLKEGIDTLKKQRQAEEKRVEEKGGEVRYPSWEALRAEDREEAPTILLTVTDADGHVVRRLTGPASAGFHRVTWDLRFPSSEPVDLDPQPPLPWSSDSVGPMAVPGSYRVSLAKRVGGTVTPLGDSQPFTTEPLGLADLPSADRKALLDFQEKVAELQRAVLGAVEARNEAAAHVLRLKKAIEDTPRADAKLAEDVRALENRLKDIQIELEGDPTKARRGEPTLPALQDRVGQVVGGSWSSTSAPTGTQRDGYETAARLFTETLARLRGLIETDLKSIEERAEGAGAPWTPGRLPRWPR